MESSTKPFGANDADAEGASPTSADDVRFPALRAIAELRHPHLAPLRASSGAGFEVEPFDGISLEKLVEGPNGEGRLALRIRVRILLDVLSGLAALHRAKLDGKPIGFVHGEVAPHNIMVGRDGLGKLVPLAASHWSTPPVPAEASLGYVAPERLLGDVFDQRADVFSIGVLLWEAIAERRLFENMRMDSIVTKLVGNKVSRPPPPPSAPWADALTDVAMQALAVDPADRWPQIGVMGAEIETIAEGALASSEEIALLVRYRLGERLPPASVAPTASSPPPTASSSLAPSSGAPSKTSTPPPTGLVVWRGPQVPRRTPDGTRRRDSMRPSVSDLGEPSRGRTKRKAAAKQSRIVWAAVGVGLALFAVTIYELVDREPPAPSAGTASQGATAAPDPVPVPPKAPQPTATAARNVPPPPAVTATVRSQSTADTGHAASKSITSTPPSHNSTPARTSAKSSPGTPSPTPPAATPSPAPTPAPAPPPAASPPEPPAPKPKEDPFGI